MCDSMSKIGRPPGPEPLASGEMRVTGCMTDQNPEDATYQVLTAGRRV